MTKNRSPSKLWLLTKQGLLPGAIYMHIEFDICQVVAQKFGSIFKASYQQKYQKWYTNMKKSRKWFS